jgi:predicted Zn-dependent protease
MRASVRIFAMGKLDTRWLASAALVAVAVLVSPAPALAHGAYHARLAAVSARIEKQPCADHYLERSAQHREHGDLEAALADLEQAERLDPRRVDLGLHRGRLALAAGRPGEAVAPLEKLLAESPGHPEAHLALARALAELGRSGAVPRAGRRTAGRRRAGGRTRRARRGPRAARTGDRPRDPR